MTERFQLEQLPIAGLIVIERIPVRDARGFFERLYCTEAFAVAGLSKPVCQINRTLTRHKGTVRGMHFQRPPYAEVKIVSCLRGEVLDVAVDLRSGSSTFLQWQAQILSSDNHRSLYIPEGFAHGFQTLTDDCEMLYLHTAAYTPAAEDGISPLDPWLNIRWPLPVSDLSERDASHSALNSNFAGITL